MKKWQIELKISRLSDLLYPPAISFCLFMEYLLKRIILRIQDLQMSVELRLRNVLISTEAKLENLPLPEKHHFYSKVHMHVVLLGLSSQILKKSYGKAFLVEYLNIHASKECTLRNICFQIRNQTLTTMISRTTMMMSRATMMMSLMTMTIRSYSLKSLRNEIWTVLIIKNFYYFKEYAPLIEYLIYHTSTFWGTVLIRKSIRASQPDNSLEKLGHIRTCNKIKLIENFNSFLKENILKSHMIYND